MLYVSLAILLQLSLFFAVGFVFVKAYQKIDNTFIVDIPQTLFLGLALFIAILGIINIFIALKVIFIFVILISILSLSMIIFWIFRYKIFKTLLFIPIIFILSIIAIPSMFHYDAHLYHIYASKLFFEYPLITGMANLQTRFGFDNSNFLLNAFFNYNDDTQRVMSSANIASFVIITYASVISLINIIKHNYTKKDFYRIVIFPFMIAMMVIERLNSQAPSIISMFLLIFVVEILLFEKYKSLAFIFYVSSVSMKFSNFYAIFFFMPFIKELNLQKSKLFITISFIMGISWIYRNIMISGHLVYPAAFTHIQTPWSLTKAQAINELNTVYHWYRYTDNGVDISNLSLIQYLTQHFFIDFPILASICFIVLGIFIFKKRILNTKEKIIIFVSILSMYIIYFQAPFFRFLMQYFYIGAILTTSIFLYYFKEKFNNKFALLLYIYCFGFIIYTSLDRRGFIVNKEDIIKPPHPLTMYINQIDFQPIKAKAIYKGKKTYARILKPKFNDFCSTINAICSPNAEHIILYFDNKQRLKKVLSY